MVYKLKRYSEKLKLYQDDIFIGDCKYNLLNIRKDTIFKFYNLDIENKGQGHGTIFITKIVELATNLNCSKIEIEVLATNTTAKKLYKKFNFRETGNHKYVDFLYLDIDTNINKETDLKDNITKGDNTIVTNIPITRTDKFLNNNSIESLKRMMKKK